MTDFKVEVGLRDWDGKYHSIARETWEKNEGEGVFKGHRYVRDKKLLLLMPKAVNGLSAIRIVAFPKPEKMNEFSLHVDKLEKGGPAYENPGAVGTVKLVRYANNVVLAYAQSHLNSKLVPRGVVTKYAGWRKRALRDAVKLVCALNVPLIIPPHLCRNRLLMNEVEQVCDELKARKEVFSAKPGVKGLVLIHPV